MRLVTTNAAVTFLLLTAAAPANGWSSSVSRRCCGPASLSKSQKIQFAPFGILDEYENNPGASADSTAPTAAEGNDAYQTLLEDIAFSTNEPRIAVMYRWDQGCSEPGFSQFLAATMEAAQDDEERKGYQLVIDAIAYERAEREKAEAEALAVAAEKEEARRQRVEEIAQSVAEATTSGKSMSTSDVLKAARQIAEGASKEAIEEDGPSDFIRDAKASAGLGGFNNDGRMSVGGG